MSKQNKVCYIYDEPVRYKNLKIYPIRVRDSVDFYTCAECLQLDKNSIPDARIISMTYLDYMLSASNEDNIYRKKAEVLLRLCLRLQNMESISGADAKDIYNSGEILWVSHLENPKTTDDIVVINNSKGLS